MSRVGIDVSSYQGIIDWKKVLKDDNDIDFAILKVIRKDLNPDNQFENNWTGCTKVGMPIHGVYNYSYATTVDKAKSDAKRVLEVLNERKTRVYLDVEDACQKGLGKLLIDIINEYAKVITAAGLEFGVYTGLSFYNSYIKPYGGVKYPLWIARYGKNDGNIDESYKPNIPGMVGWQFTSKSKVDGISGNVDMNIWYEEIENSKKEEGQEIAMSVMIGHASIDERKAIKGGVAGDQTGKEVVTRSWYSKPWSYVLRPKRADLAEKSAAACEQACANSNIGYDQNQRNTLHTQAKAVNFDISKIKTSCECDCSSLMHVCALAGGANIPYRTNGAATINMKTRFTANGDYEVLTASKYLTSDKYLKRGDILVTPGSHTVMVLNNGSAAGTSETNTPTTSTNTTYTLKQFIKDVQKATGAKVDGIAGPETIGKTVTVSAKKNSRHAVVKPLQKRLNALGYNCGTVDGIAGPKFTAAVNSYQKNVLKYKNPDGEITATNKMWKKLLGMI